MPLFLGGTLSEILADNSDAIYCEQHKENEEKDFYHLILILCHSGEQ